MWADAGVRRRACATGLYVLGRLKKDAGGWQGRSAVSHREKRKGGNGPLKTPWSLSLWNTADGRRPTARVWCGCAHGVAHGQPLLPAADFIVFS